MKPASGERDGMASTKKVAVKLGRNPGRVPTIVNKTGKPPGAKSLDGQPLTKKPTSGSEGDDKG